MTTPEIAATVRAESELLAYLSQLIVGDDEEGSGGGSSSGLLFPFACRAAAAMCWQCECGAATAEALQWPKALASYIEAAILRHRGTEDESSVCAAWEALSACATSARGQSALLRQGVSLMQSIDPVVKVVCQRGSIAMRIALLEFLRCCCHAPPAATPPTTTSSLPQQQDVSSLGSTKPLLRMTLFSADVLHHIWMLREHQDRAVRTSLWWTLAAYLGSEQAPSSAEQRAEDDAATRRMDATCAAFLSAKMQEEREPSVRQAMLVAVACCVSKKDASTLPFQDGLRRHLAQGVYPPPIRREDDVVVGSEYRR